MMNQPHAEAPNLSFKHNYAPVGSFADVVNSDAEVFWQDTENSIVWIRVTLGDLSQFHAPSEAESADQNSDYFIYNTFDLRIW